MAHTTTASSTYSLIKYSRSYPAENSNNADWQHFTNPVLRLVLNVTKTAKSETQSVQLKVVWTLQNGGIMNVNDNAEIEDIDLLAFSSLPPGALMSVPLKAVYRDTTVGIRYLFPVEATNTSVFRRFQISFASEHDTNAFIASIRGVCPCKMSTAATSNSQRQLYTPAGPVSNLSSQGSQYPYYGLAIPEAQPSTGTTIRAYPPGHPSGSLAQSNSPMIYTHILQPSTMPPPPVPSQALQKSLSAPDLDGSDTVSSQGVNPTSIPQIMPSSHLSSQTAMSSSQASAPAQPIDSINSLSEAEKITAPAGQESSLHPMISALQETTSIYSLPLDVLEHVVGDVIREDGFVSLVEKLSNMWKIKTLVVKS